MTRLIDVVLAVVLVLAVGFPLSYALFSRVLFALFIAPFITALTASAATFGMILLGGQLVWWMAPLILAQWASAVLLIRRRGRPAPLAQTEAKEMLWLSVPLLPLLALVLDVPTSQWDAQMIWWMHGGIFAQGSEFTRHALSHVDFAFTHPDYPPAMSATVGGVWSVIDGYDLYVARFVSSVLSLSAVISVGYAVRTVTRKAPAYVSRAAALCSLLPFWMLNPGGVTGGESDVLWAGAFVAAALLIFVGESWTERPILPLVLLSIAALSKNEGLVAVGILVVFAAWKHRRKLSSVRWLLLPVALGLGWSTMAHALGAESGQFDADLLPEFFKPSVFQARLAEVMDTMWLNAGRPAFLAIAVAILGAVLLRPRRVSLSIGSDGWVWAIFAAYFAVLLLTYLLTPHPLTWHLGTSATRTLLPLTLLASASVAIWAAIAFTEPPSATH